MFSISRDGINIQDLAAGRMIRYLGIGQVYETWRRNESVRDGTDKPLFDLNKNSDEIV